MEHMKSKHRCFAVYNVTRGHQELHFLEISHHKIFFFDSFLNDLKMQKPFLAHRLCKSSGGKGLALG